MLGNIGAPEIILIFSALLLLFGAKKLPEIAKGMGKGIKEFKHEINTINDSIKTTTEEVKKWKNSYLFQQSCFYLPL